MKRMSWYSLTLLLLFVWTGIGFAADPKVDNKMGIITGGEKGTYYQFGLDLQKLMRLSEVTLNVYNSKGSIENVFAVYQRPGIQLGIVQSDVLAFISRLQTDQNLIKIAKKTRITCSAGAGSRISRISTVSAWPSAATAAAPSSPPACSCSCPT